MKTPQVPAIPGTSPLGLKDQSEVVVGPGGTTFAGPDGVALYRAMALRSGLAMYARSGMRPNWVWTPSAMLAAAGGVTGKVYKRGQYEVAADDLQVWIEAMKAAIPVSKR